MIEANGVPELEPCDHVRQCTGKHDVIHDQMRIFLLQYQYVRSTIDVPAYSMAYQQLTNILCAFFPVCSNSSTLGHLLIQTHLPL